MPEWWKKYRVDVPAGKQGPWRVERFEVSKKDAEFSQLRSMFSSERGRGVAAGTYTRLISGRANSFRSTVMMSDTSAEIGDHLGFINRAHGEVLIGGLGLGMVAQACLRRHADTRVTIIEKDLDIIGLVGPHYEKRFGDRFQIVHGDVFTWKPPKGQRWDYAWWDIWPTICTDNLPEMHKLHRRVGGRINVQQMSWCRAACERYREQGRQRRY